MDMRRAPGIGHRADGAKAIATVRRRDEAAVALKPGVEPLAIAATAVQVDAVGIDLPDFHQRPGQRPTAGVEDRAMQLHMDASRFLGPTFDLHQIVVAI